MKLAYSSSLHSLFAVVLSTVVLPFAAAAQNVGIGTTLPLERLHVNGNVRINPLAGAGNRIVQASNVGNLVALPDGTAGQVLTTNGAGTLSWTTPAGGGLNTAVVLNTNGTVAVTDPGGTLTSTAAAWMVGGNALLATGSFGTTSNNHVDLVTNNLVRGRLSNLGEFFIGTTATVIPGDLMNAVATTAFPWALNGYTTLNGGGTYGLRQTGSTGVWGGVQGELELVIPAGSSGVYGGGSANTHTGVRGTRPAGGPPGTGFGGEFYNDLFYTGGFYTVSDASLKHSLQPVTGAIGMVKQLPIYSYEFNTTDFNMLGDPGLRHFGVLSTDLKKVLPQLVAEKLLPNAPHRAHPELTLRAPGMVDVVNYLELVPIALKAIQEQQDQIEALQAELEALKAIK